MVGAGGVEMSVDQREITTIAKAMRKERDGVALRRDLIVNLRVAVAPGVSAVQEKLRSIPHESATPSSPALGSYLASRVKPQVRLGGTSAGVAIRIAKTPKLRKFNVASRVLNTGSWRHPVYGHDVWVTQTSPIPGYFDDTLSEGKERYRAAVVAALARMRMRLEFRGKL